MGTILGHGDLHPPGSMVGICLDIPGVKPMAFKKIQDVPAQIIPAHPGDKPHLKPQVLQVKGKVKGGTADPFIGREQVEQNFSDHQNHGSP